MNFLRMLGRSAPRAVRGVRDFFGGLRQGSAAAGAGATKAAQATLPNMPAATAAAPRAGSVLLGTFGGRGGAARQIPSMAANVLRRTPGGLLGVGALGLAGSSIYNRINPPEAPDIAGMLGTSGTSAGTGAGPGGMSIEEQLALMDMANQRTRDVLAGMQADTSSRDRINEDLARAQALGEAYVGARAPAMREEFGSYGEETAAQADALRRLAEAASGTISGVAEEGAADVEQMLYGSPAASEVSGLTPLPSYLSDVPAVARAEGDIAAQSALRDLMGSADAMQFAADQAQRYGAGYAGELADDVALQQMALDAAARQQIRAEEAGLRNLARQLELEQAGQRGQMEFNLRMEEAAREQQDELVLQTVLANTEVLDEIVREWEALDADRKALLAQQGIDFRRFAIERGRAALGG